METEEKIWIGIEAGEAANSHVTREQIQACKAFELKLQHDGKAIVWGDLDDENEPRTLLLMRLHMVPGGQKCSMRTVKRSVTSASYAQCNYKDRKSSSFPRVRELL